MAVASPPPYTDPGAIAGVLGMRSPENQQMAINQLGPSPENQQIAMNQLGPSPENQAIAGGIAEGGLGNFLAQGNAPADPTGMPSDSNTLDSIERMQRMEVKSQWLMENQDERVPWDPEKTWGQYLEEKYTAAEKDKPGSGPDVVDEIIDQQLEVAPPPVEPAPTPPVMPPPGLPAAPGGPESRIAGEVPPGAGAGGVPVVRTEPMPSDPMMSAGIMGAAGGGLVRGYAQGGVVGEQEFLDQVGMLADQAGIPAGDMEAVADVASNTAGGPDEVMDTGIMQTVEATPAEETDFTGVGSLEGLSSQLAEAGEEGLAHVSEGEIVIPYMELSPDSQRMVMAALDAGGIDPNRYTVGNDANVINEMTGLPAFGFFSKISRGVKKIGKFLKRNAGTILGIAGAMTGNPWLAALGSGIGTLIEGKGIKQALVGAGMAYVGSRWIGPWIGEKVGAGLNYLGGANIPTGEVLQGVTGGDWASGLAGLTEQGLANQAALKGAYGAAAEEVTRLGTNVGADALMEAGSAAARDSLVENIVGSQGLGALGLTETAMEGINQTAAKIGSDLSGRVLTGATQGMMGFGAKNPPTKLTLGVPDPVIASTYGGPTEGFTEGLKGYAANVAATPIGDLTGRAAGSYMTEAYGTPMVKEYLGMGIPNPDDVLDEWNKRYNYTPTGEQLYQFYTDQYVPNLQIDPDIIKGTPGYPGTATASANAWNPGGLPLGALGGGIMGGQSPLLAAEGGYVTGYRNGGYVKGIGGPKSDENLARLSNGEFVFTEAAVRGAGEGDRLAGARRMYNMMRDLEQRAAPGYAHGGLHSTQFPSDLSEVDRLRLQRLGYVEGTYTEPPPPPSPEPFLGGTAWSLNPNEPQDPFYHGEWPDPAPPAHFGTPEPSPLPEPGEEVLSRDVTVTAQQVQNIAKGSGLPSIPLPSVVPQTVGKATKELTEYLGVPGAKTITGLAQKWAGNVGPGKLATLAGWLGWAPATPVQIGLGAATLGKAALDRAIERQHEINKVAFMDKYAPPISGNWFSGFGPPTAESWQTSLEQSMADPEFPGRGDVGGMHENRLDRTKWGKIGEEIKAYQMGEDQRERELIAETQKRAAAVRADEQAKKDLAVRLARGRARGKREFEWGEVEREVAAQGPAEQVDEPGQESPGPSWGADIGDMW